jgi:hypothetical protein
MYVQYKDNTQEAHHQEFGSIFPAKASSDHQLLERLSLSASLEA